MKRRPDGRWQKKITLPNGKSKILYSTASSERLAVKDFNDQMLKLQQEEENSYKFSVIAEKWNTDYRKRISDINYNKSTKATYNKIFEHFKDDYINTISTSDIHRYINILIGKQNSQKTISTHKSILNMIFNYAILNGFIEANPVSVITLPGNLPKKQRLMPTDDELKKVSSEWEGFSLLPYFLLHTGLRKSEALALDYSDIDFEKKTITVNKRLLHNGNRPVHENKTKTENAKRTVILLDRLAEKMQKNGTGVIFCNKEGKHLTKREYDIRWKKWQKEHNTSLTAHQLRHGFATMLYEAGIPEKDAQELMGHSDINLTRQIYTHIRDKRKEETAQKLNDFNFNF